MKVMLDPRSGWSRAVKSLPAIAQLVLAATLSYIFAHFILGHHQPVLSVTVTITSLGLVRDATPQRVLETALAMSFGIMVSEVILLVIGNGAWQLAVVLLVTLFLARIFSPRGGFAISAAVQSALVVILPPAVGGPFIKSFDGFIGAAAALLATALIPRDVIRATHRDIDAVFHELSTIVALLVQSLKKGDRSMSVKALTKARATQPLFDAWKTSLTSAVSIAKISPFKRKHLAELQREQKSYFHMDLAGRNLRVVARKVNSMVRDGVPRSELADVFAQLNESIQTLGESYTDESRLEHAQELLQDIAQQLDPQEVTPGTPRRVQEAVLLLRPLVVDLLEASGLAPEEAEEPLPEL